MPRLRGGCWPWLWCLRALIGHARRRVAGWIVRPFGEADQETFRATVSPPTGCIAITPRVWRGFRTAGRGHAFGALRLRRWRSLRPSVGVELAIFGRGRAGPRVRRGGALAAERSGTPDCLGFRGRGARAHGRHLSGDIGVSQAAGRARSTRKPIHSPRRLSKKLRCGGRGGDCAGRARQTCRGLVPGVSRARKQSGELFSRRTRAWGSREP